MINSITTNNRIILSIQRQRLFEFKFDEWFYEREEMNWLI
jgi:hypothetical protein